MIMRGLTKSVAITSTSVCLAYMVTMLSSCKENVAPPNAMIINVKAGFVDTVTDPSLKVWFTVSDLNGNLIGSQRATSDQQQLTFTYDDSIRDENVYLSRITLSASTANIVCSGISFEVPRRSQFTFAPADPISIVGVSDVTITNLSVKPYSYLFTLDAGNNGLSTFAGSSLSLEMGHIKSPDNLFIAILPTQQSTPYFKWIKNIEVQKQYQVDFNTFKAMHSHQVTLPQNDGAGYTLSGSTTGSDIHPISYALVGGDHSIATVFSPDTLFSQYILNLKFYKGDNQFEVNTSTRAVPLSVDEPTLGLSIVKNSPADFSMTTQGTYDYAITYFGNAESNFGWVVYKPANATINGVVPQVPPDIAKLFPSANRNDLILIKAKVFDDGSINGYSDFVKNLGTPVPQPNVFRSLTKAVQ